MGTNGIGRGEDEGRRSRETAAKGTKLRASAFALALFLLLLPVLSGCMYPKELRKENQASIAESLLVVQHAVERYKEQTGVLPIKNSDQTTPLYEKYVLDMKKMMQGGYIGQVPGIAFEMGGSAMFVLVNPESQPEVKLLDLTRHQQAGDVERWVEEYRRANGGAIPSGEAAGPDVFRLDFDKLGKKPVQVESVYSRAYTTFLVGADGTVGIDYAADVMKAMEKRGMQSAESGSDLRALLVAESPYVPVKSFPYYWIDNEPKPSAR